MHSSRRLDERARLEIVRDNMGHVECRRDPECLRQSWWEERVDAATQAVESVQANDILYRLSRDILYTSARPPARFASLRIVRCWGLRLIRQRHVSENLFRGN